MADNPKNQGDIEEKVTNWVHKTLVLGGFSSGGGIALFQLAQEEADIAKALFALAVGSSISLATKFFLPIQQRNEERAENLGKAVNRIADGAGEKIYNKALSTEDKYLAAQAAACELIKTEGAGKIPGLRNNLMLEKVFVTLELDRNMAAAGFRCLEEDILQNPELFKNRGDGLTDIWKLLAKAQQNKLFRQIGILAWGGYGKTTLLRHIAYTLGKSEKPAFIPVLLLLRQYRDILTSENPPTLPHLIAEEHIPRIQTDKTINLSANWATEQLRKGKLLIMLDGFDEVPSQHRPKVAAWLNVQMRKYSKSVFILTSRPKAYTEQEAGDSLDLYSLLHVRPFEAKQRQEFVEKWYWCQEYYDYGQDSEAIQTEARTSARELLAQIEHRKELRDLASNPLLLTMIARFHRRYPGAELPKHRSKLYQEICKLQLQDRPNARKLETLLSNCEAQLILQMLALEMMQRKEERLEERVLVQRIKGYLVDQEESLDAKVFLEQVEQISELLVEREPEEYEFAHLSFQEFLAAMEVNRLGQEEILQAHFTEDWWKQTILLYVGKVRKPSRIIRAIREAGAQELAYQCTQETTKRIDGDLLQDREELANLQAEQKSVTAERYQQLEKLLINKKWKDADYETSRLMITAVGKDAGQGFSEQDLKEFPCEELLAIDRLWVKHSNGLYGFSVQKYIYVQCGGTLDFEIPSNEVFIKYYEAIAWREEGEWKLKWKELLKESRMGVQGHYPVVSGMEWRFVYLFSQDAL